MTTRVNEADVLPELKQIVGSLLFAAKQPMTAGDIRKVLKDTARDYEGAATDFAGLKEKDIAEAVEALDKDLREVKTGIHVAEVANGYRLQNDVSCGIWLRTMLDKGRSNRLSKPALETLAIVAYRQPCTRAEVESVRGVAVDAVLKNLIEMQLVKVLGRSELPGRPWLFGTTQKFLEYFGLRSLDDLPGIEELKRRERQAEALRAVEEAQQESPPLFPEEGDEEGPSEEPAGEERTEGDEGLAEEDAMVEEGVEDSREASEEEDLEEDEEEEYDEEDEEEYDDEEEFDEDEDEDDDDEDEDADEEASRR